MEVNETDKKGLKTRNTFVKYSVSMQDARLTEENYKESPDKLKLFILPPSCKTSQDS